MRFYVCFCLSLFVLFFIGSSAMAGMITPELQELLSTVDEETYVPVIIELVEQADIQTLDRQLKEERATRADRHLRVITMLQEVANRTQPELLAEIAGEEELNNVKNVEAYWIVNTIRVEAQKVAIEKLVNHPAIAFIREEAQIKMIKPVESHPAPRSVGGTEPGIRAIRADKVWYTFGLKGEGTIVSNLDTGVDYTHPAIYDNWRGNQAGVPWNACWKAATGMYPTDEEGHGTHTMGTMCGMDPATNDTVGVAPAALWIAADILGANEVSTSAAFQWLADPDGNPNTIDDVPQVINNSWGCYQGNEYNTPCLRCDAYNGMDNCEATGIVVLWSAGNEGDAGEGSIGSPADRVQSAYNAFSIGSTSPVLPYTIADYSSRGPSDCDNVSIKPEVVAPGSSIRSSDLDSTYTYQSGTSMASPHVSGVVALMRQANPQMEVNDIKEALMRTAHDLGEAGEDNNYGWGFIDAFDAVARYALELPKFFLLEVTVDDATGNNDGRPDPGETVEVNIRVMNIWQNTALAPIAELTVESPIIEFETQSVTYPEIPGDGVAENEEPFVFSVADEAAGETLQFTLRITTEMANGEPNPWIYELPFELVIGRPRVLVVDDDNGADYEKYYRAALDTAGIKYEVWNIMSQGVPTETQFAHEAIVWYTGDAGQTTLDDDEQAFLMAFMDNGGPLFITGQDIGWDLVLEDNGADFYTNYLHAELVSEEYTGPMMLLRGIDEDDLSEGWRIVAQGQGGANNQDSPSVIAPLGEAEETLLYLGSSAWGAGGIKYAGADYRMVYFSFGFEAVLETASGDAPHIIIEDILSWLGIVSVEHSGPEVSVPARVELDQNYPNPFNPATSISYAVAKASDVSLSIYNTAGQLVKTVVNEPQSEGRYTAKWDGTNEVNESVASGVYFYTLHVGDVTKTRSMVLLK